MKATYRREPDVGGYHVYSVEVGSTSGAVYARPDLADSAIEEMIQELLYFARRGTCGLSS